MVFAMSAGSAARPSGLAARMADSQSWSVGKVARPIGVSVTPWFVLALALVVVAHLAGGGNWVMSAYALQIEVPDELRGRVFAADTMIATLAVTVSTLTVGLFIDTVDARILIAACGAVTLVYAVVWRVITLRLPAHVDAATELVGARP